MANLKLEVFESKNSIEPLEFFIYKITPKEQVSSIQQFMRSSAGKIGYRLSIPAFTDDSVPPKVNLDKTSKANKVVKSLGYFSRIPAS